VLAAPGVPRRWQEPDYTAELLPVVPVEFSRDGRTLRYFSMVTTVGTPQDIAAQEIRQENFFPTDDATAAHRWDRVSVRGSRPAPRAARPAPPPG
jgi:hypothetical protein